MKAMHFGLAMVALVAGGAALAHEGKHPASAAEVAAAIADPARADQSGDDQRRHAAEVVAFTTAGPGSTVIDFLPGEGYWTRILTGVVGPTGHVYAAWPQAGAKRAGVIIPKIDALKLANVTAEVLPGNGLSAPQPVNIVMTVQNYHDLHNTPGGDATIEAFNKSVFNVLKPGGVYIVIDHADAAGSGVSGTSSRHRIDEAVVKAEALKAGFVLDAESNALANPADDHSKPVFDESIRGHTDQFMLRFRKPA